MIVLSEVLRKLVVFRLEQFVILVEEILDLTKRLALFVKRIKNDNVLSMEAEINFQPPFLFLQ